ncbi:MAG: hypothetical protein R6T98_00355 [Desulfatiglandales bacterium]
MHALREGLQYEFLSFSRPKELAAFNPDYAVGIVTRVEKPQRNEKLERLCAEGILVHMLRSKIVKGALQQGFSGRSRWLLHNLGLITISFGITLL